MNIYNAFADIIADIKRAEGSFGINILPRRAPRIFQGRGGFQTKGHNFEDENDSMQKFEKPIFRF